MPDEMCFQFKMIIITIFGLAHKELAFKIIDFILYSSLFFADISVLLERRRFVPDISLLIL